MSKVLVVTAKPGPTSRDRMVLAQQTAAGTEPTLPSSGYYLNRVEYIHLLFKLTNTDVNNPCTFYVQLWWWSPITEVWHKGERVKVNSDDIHTIECQGLNRLYLQIDHVAFSGTGTPSLDAWIGMVVPV